MKRRNPDAEALNPCAFSSVQTGSMRHRVEPVGHVEWTMPKDLTWVPSPRTSGGPATF
jgi:hypothetical protein